jgi:hypothetical protein
MSIYVVERELTLERFKGDELRRGVALDDTSPIISKKNKKYDICF